MQSLIKFYSSMGMSKVLNLGSPLWLHLEIVIKYESKTSL